MRRLLTPAQMREMENAYMEQTSTPSSALMERAAARSLTAISAYIDPDEVNSAAWQVLSGREGLSAALMPLL